MAQGTVKWFNADKGFGFISVEDDTAVVVDFGTQQVRIATPCAKLNKL